MHRTMQREKCRSDHLPRRITPGLEGDLTVAELDRTRPKLDLTPAEGYRTPRRTGSDRT
jgi:hypothetical protein